MNVHSWLKRADAILADEDFDVLAALSLVREILYSPGSSNNLRTAAEEAQASGQAANRSPQNKWQTAVAKQRFQALRTAIAHSAFRA